MSVGALLALEGLAVMVLIKSGVLAWTHCCRHKRSGVYVLALYFVQVSTLKGLALLPLLLLLLLTQAWTTSSHSHVCFCCCPC